MKNLLSNFSIYILLLFICINLSVKGNTTGNVNISPDNSQIEYTGRIDFSNPLAPRFSYSGVSIRASFSGTTIAAIMDDDIGQNYYNILIDGVLVDTLQVTAGKKSYQLAKSLKDTIHEIEIFKRTELTFGKTSFYGFILDNGASLQPLSNNRKLMIEYIGNSITCGYGNEGINGGVFGPTTENHYLTYAAITSRNFNARHLAVCRSGIGIYRNYDGPAAGNTDCMTNFYARTFLYDENPKYSFTDRPDLVCIDLGTNDFSTTGGDSAKFASNYFRLIDTIQTKYTMPDIVCLMGPMLSGSSLNNMKKYLNYIAATATLKGKGNVYFFEMSAQTGDLGIGIDYHPTVAQHQKNALELTAFIKSIKGWKMKPAILGATIIGANHLKIDFNTPMLDDHNRFSGFSIVADGLVIDNENCYADATDKKTVHIMLKQNIKVGAKVNLNYLPGTIQSNDSIMLGAYTNLMVVNMLTETKVLKGTTSANGATVMLTFNKKIRQNSTLEGLSVTDSRGVIAIDSFKIVNAVLTLYMNDKLIKGDSIFADYSGTNIFGSDDMALTPFSRLVVKNASTYTGNSNYAQNLIMIYPNPSNSGRLNYSFSGIAHPQKVSLDIYNSKGSKMFSQLLSSTKGTINLEGTVSKGLYIFDFTLDNTIVKKSVLIE